MAVQHDFTDKVVLITGAGSGFGKLAAEKFAAAGARVALGDINLAAVEQLAKQLQAQGSEAIACVCDVANSGQMKAFVDATIEQFGRLDIALNNAGLVHEMLRIGDISEEIFDTNIAVNLKGVFLGMKYQLPVMAAQGGGVVLNTASAAGLVGSPFLGVYVASKHAVVGMTKSAALEYGRKGVRVNTICPAFSHTSLMDDIIDDKGAGIVDAMASGNPLQRLAEPEEVVNVMLWLCSDDNTYMNGAAVPVDGGLTAS